MGPLAGTALTPTSNATGSGGGHGGMGSLGCGVYRWDSNYNTCACTVIFPPAISQQHIMLLLPSHSYGTLVWNGLGGFGSGGGDGEVQGGQGGGAVFLQVNRIPISSLFCSITVLCSLFFLPPQFLNLYHQTLSLKPQASNSYPPHQVLQALLVYGKVSSNGESSRCAKTQNGTSLSSGT
jgi:hypothetical protein